MAVDIAIQTDAIKCRELLSSWESLLHWSENESFVKQAQEEMATLISKLYQIGTSEPNLETESAIQMALQESKDENAQLHTYRSSMLRLNASVHSWLTRHENRKQFEKSTNKMAIKSTPQADNTANQDERDGNGNTNVDDESTLDLTTVSIKETSPGLAVGTSIDADDFTVNEELHKQLKNEVGNMYKVWDEADERVKKRLDSLTTSLIAWKQFESGIDEFKEALGKDTGTLKRITGALELGSDVVTNHFASDVKEVAKRLSEKMNTQPTIAVHSGQQASSSQPSTKLNHIAPMAFNMPSNGSLSDSGISDGGFSSDYGLSERERRLGALRRLAKQLEQALVPGSEALNSINQRMEMAEAELRSLQETCRELIVRTAASHPNHFPAANQWNGQSAAMLEGNSIPSTSTDVINQQPINFQMPIINVKSKTVKRTTPNKRKPRRRTDSNGLAGITLVQSQQKSMTPLVSAVASEPDPDDPKGGSAIEEDDEKPTWSRRVAKYAIPVQLALIALFCAACFMEPHCCDGLNNFTWSLSPQLRYIRGPPPI